MIQIDMPMPTNCIDCPACNEYLMCAIPANGRGWGENDVKDFSQGRPEWCPMKEQKLVRCDDCGYSFCEGFVLKRLYCEKHPELGEIKGDWFCADCWKA